ncbi:polysaccharide deacetylase family protein, partial [Streptomyces parvus]
MDGRRAPMGRRDVLGVGAAGALAAALSTGCARRDGPGRTAAPGPSARLLYP